MPNAAQSYPLHTSLSKARPLTTLKLSCRTSIFSYRSMDSVFSLLHLPLETAPLDNLRTLEIQFDLTVTVTIPTNAQVFIASNFCKEIRWDELRRLLRRCTALQRLKFRVVVDISSSVEGFLTIHDSDSDPDDDGEPAPDRTPRKQERYRLEMSSVVARTVAKELEEWGKRRVLEISVA